MPRRSAPLRSLLPSPFTRRAALSACLAAATVCAVFAGRASGTAAAPAEAPPSSPLQPQQERTALSALLLSGGENATSYNDSGEAFSRPLPSLPVTQLRSFSFGNKLFNTVWAETPASVTTLDGKGPTFNRPSCSSCHFKDGRGRPPADETEPMDSMLVRLSVPAKAGETPPVPHPAYGGQLNDRAIPGVPAEGRALVFYHPHAVTYPDGTSVNLREPYLAFEDLAFGELGPETMASPRVAPAVFGLGLLEAVPETDLLNRADPDDKDGDGISGRPNMTANASAGGALKPGRFGWKAGAPSIMHQTAAAAIGDIGLTSPYFPQENCPAPQTACRAAPRGEGEATDLSALQLQKMEFYLRTLAVPARREADSPGARQGEALFTQTGCAACHTPELKTGETAAVPALANQTFRPYTDLLLHDMGEGLADHRPDGLASGSEWRTAPLWGLGLIKRVNGHDNLLHDGRARGPEEAILWHGGEAEAAKRKFMRLKKEERNALLQFLESL